MTNNCCAVVEDFDAFDKGSHDESENSEPSPPRSRCRRYLASCSFLRALIVTIHFIILATAIICMIPLGVMTSVQRAFMSGVITFVWLICCCIMVTSNIVYFARQRLRKKNQDFIEEQTESRKSASCNEMGCLASFCVDLCVQYSQQWINR